MKDEPLESLLQLLPRQIPMLEGEDIFLKLDGVPLESSKSLLEQDLACDEITLELSIRSRTDRTNKKPR